MPFRGRADLFAPEIAIGFCEPIGPRRVKDVEVNGIFKGLGLVRHIGRNGEHLTATNDDLSAVDQKLERPLENIAELFIDVTMQGDDTALLEQNPGEHYFFAHNQLPLQERIERLEFHLFPSQMLQLGWFSLALGRPLQAKLLACGRTFGAMGCFLFHSKPLISSAVYEYGLTRDIGSTLGGQPYDNICHLTGFSNAL
jgi:hypothetical protein